jgi:hypothetical protein
MLCRLKRKICYRLYFCEKQRKRLLSRRSETGGFCQPVSGGKMLPAAGRPFFGGRRLTPCSTPPDAFSKPQQAAAIKPPPPAIQKSADGLAFLRFSGYTALRQQSGKNTQQNKRL